MESANDIQQPNYHLFKRMVVAIVAAVILVTIAFSVWKSISEYRLTIHGAEQQTRGYASALKEHAERTINEADTALLDVSEHLEEHGGVAAFSNKNLRLLLENHRRNAPQISSVFLINRSGQIVEHSAESTLLQSNVSDSDYFIHHRGHPAEKFPFLSKPLKDRINGKRRIILSRPIKGANGEFAGVVAAALAPEYFQTFYATLELGKNGRILIVRRDGELLLSMPYQESDYGTDFKKSHLIRTHLPTSPHGTYHIASGKALLESNARIVSYDSMERLPVVALANIDKEEILALWKRNSYIQAVLVVVISIVMALMALILLRHIRRIEDAHCVQLTQQSEIAASAEVWQVTFDAMEDAIWVIDLNRKVQRANRATEKIFGCERGGIIGRTCCEYTRHCFATDAACSFRDMLKTGHRASSQTYFIDRYYSYTVDPVKNSAGEITGAIHIVSDISKMKLAEEQLVKQEQEFRSLAENLPDNIIRYDCNCRTLYVNPVLEQTLGIPAERLIGLTPTEIFPNGEFSDYIAILKRVINTGIDAEMEMIVPGEANAVSHHQIRFVMERDSKGTATGILAIGRDITSYKLAEQALLDRQQRISDMALELAMTEERERSRIATNLHDTIGQDLALTRINLGILARASLSAEEVKTLGNTRDRINSAIKSVRHLTHLISPPILESAGLEAALKWLSRQMESDYGLQVQFEDDQCEKAVSREIRSELYFTVRELLINVTKHAKTTSARLSVARNTDSLVIKIEDDGIGFDPDFISSPDSVESGFGLFNVRRRIIYLGGTFEIESSPETGTRVTIAMPMVKSNDEFTIHHSTLDFTETS